jgi:hypothetical protein
MNRIEERMDSFLHSTLDVRCSMLDVQPYLFSPVDSAYLADPSSAVALLRMVEALAQAGDPV